MLCRLLMVCLTLALDLLAIIRVTDSEKDLEIIVLRQQVRILQRKVKTAPRITDPERMVLATLTHRFRQKTANARHRLDQMMLIFKPATVLRWPLQNRHAGRTYFEMEKPGDPSRWNTLRALRVLRWWEAAAGGNSA